MTDINQTMLIKSSPCPCGSGMTYSSCCLPWHTQGKTYLTAPTPEALMRSRYVAYVLDLTDYLMDTWHPDTRPSKIDTNPPTLKWLELIIKGCPSDHTVHFIARYEFEGQKQHLEECSRFSVHDGHWLYVDGEIFD